MISITNTSSPGTTSAGAASSGSISSQATARTTPAASADTARDPAVIVSLSPAAKAKAAAGEALRDFALVAKDARAVLDAQYADARAKGTSVTFDLSKPGVPLDLSSLSDRAVAAIALNKQGDFYSDEVLWAKGELTKRTQAVLKTASAGAAPNDPRSFMGSVISQYDSMTQEVRDALGWTKQMRADTEKFLKTEEAKNGKSKDKSIVNFFDFFKKFNIC